MKKVIILLCVLFGIALLTAATSAQGATYRPPVSTIPDGSITSAKITDGTIVNADVSASAQIASSKLRFNGIAYTFPASDGSSGSALTTNGAGTLAWTSFATTSPTLSPIPTYPTAWGTGGKTYTVNTTAFISAFQLNAPITPASLTFRATSIGSAGTFQVGIYSGDGTRLLASGTTPTISANGAVTTTLSPTTRLPAGMYYFMLVPVGSTNIDVASYSHVSTLALELNVVSGQPQLFGTSTVSAGTLPSSFDPTALTSTTNAALPLMRFDD